MCNRIDNSDLSIEEVSRAMAAEISEENYYFSRDVNAFDHPAIPIVLDYQGKKITHGTWGLFKNIPKDRPAQGINLRAEKSHTNYKRFEQKRCVVPVTGYYDWMHVTVPGKKVKVTVKHRMEWIDIPQFYIAAYYDVWENNQIGFGMLTTEPNEVMTRVHNSTLRMIISMDAGMANKFLSNEPIENFLFPTYDPKIIDVNLEPHKMPQTLF